MNFVLVFTFVIGIQLLFTHALALTLHLYWLFWWLDIIMHFLGGVWLVFIWRVLTTMKIIPPRWWKFRIILPISFLVMIVWEIFGVYVEAGFKADYLIDTVSDIWYGIVGVIVGFWLLNRLQKLDNFSKE